jgi:hypothetical protein
MGPLPVTVRARSNPSGSLGGVSERFHVGVLRTLGSVCKGSPGSQRIGMTMTEAARKESARLS